MRDIAPRCAAASAARTHNKSSNEKEHLWPERPVDLYHLKANPTLQASSKLLRILFFHEHPPEALNVDLPDLAFADGRADGGKDWFSPQAGMHPKAQFVPSALNRHAKRVSPSNPKNEIRFWRPICAVIAQKSSNQARSGACL
jgi:hypothetical protein